MLQAVTEALWFPWLTGLFLLVGLVYSLGSCFFQLFGWRIWMRETLGSLGRGRREPSEGLSPARALAAALASTLGTGSIAGVASAITAGGPGALFWMWLFALLGMMTGCGEKLLAVRYQQQTPEGLAGGPMYCLRDGLHAPRLAVLFALALLPASLTGGNLIQVSSMADVLEQALGLPRLFTGLGLLLPTALILRGGLGGTLRCASALAPVMALLYLGGGALALLLRIRQLPEVLALILRSALCPEAAAGGAAGFTVLSALRYGAARGIFTNEAGLGTSAIAHGSARTDHPARQGMWGILEVFLSTLGVSTLTGLVILTGGLRPDSGLTGAALTSAAFTAVLGPAGGALVTLSLLLFAFSSLLGWSCYGSSALCFLPGGRRLLPLWQLLFLLCILPGALWSGERLWLLVDLCSALLALPNLFSLLFLAPQALKLLNEWLFTTKQAP